MAPSVSVNFISLVTSCVGLQEEEPQTAPPMSFTWVSHIAASMLTECKTLTQSICLLHWTRSIWTQFTQDLYGYLTATVLRWVLLLHFEGLLCPADAWWRRQREHWVVVQLSLKQSRVISFIMSISYVCVFQQSPSEPRPEHPPQIAERAHEKAWLVLKWYNIDAK